jgi:hypothetical protein
MKMMRMSAVVLGALLAISQGPAQAGVRVGIGIGLPLFPGPCYYPYYRPYPYYYPGYVYVAPPPVVVAPAPATVVAPATVAAAPAPVVSQSAPATLQAPPATQNNYQAQSSPLPPAPEPVVRAAAAEERQVTADGYLQMLNNADERVRAEAVLQLGRMRADRAVDPLAATLAGDRSPAVRETAARALGLIGSPRALTVLQHAAQADADRDVRRSAQFAAEVIQTNPRR